jgi:release factor glutamine methyltransferase
MKAIEYLHLIASKLSDHYDSSESKSLARWILEELTHQLFTDLLILETIQIDETRLDDIIEKLHDYVPIQQIFGYTYFHGRRFYVNQDTLIPRPETEELVEWIRHDLSNDNLKLLDIGTGTGIIPITVKISNPNIECHGWDVSLKALDMAKKNAAIHGTNIQWSHVDILEAPESNSSFDIVVSNPPYVLASEKSHLEHNVSKYEPELALYVPDDDPLIFYRIIIKFCQKYLLKYGKLYFEIHRDYSHEIQKLYNENGFEDVVIKKDINDNPRMASGTKKY